MKVVYEKTVEEKVKDAISKAELEGRKIEKIVLSRKDFKELYNTCYTSSPSGRGCPAKNKDNYSSYTYCGVKIEAAKLLL